MSYSSIQHEDAERNKLLSTFYLKGDLAGNEVVVTPELVMRGGDVNGNSGTNSSSGSGHVVIWQSHSDVGSWTWRRTARDNKVNQRRMTVGCVKPTMLGVVFFDIFIYCIQR